MRTRRIASRRQWVTRPAVIIFCACWLASAWRAEGQEDGGAVGGIRGVILDAEAGDPIGNARVTIGELGQTLSSDAQGRFVFDAVRPGIYEITVAKSGYARERRGEIAVTAGVFREVRVTMTSEVYEMEELVVSGELVGEGETALLIERQESSGILESIGAEAFSKAGISDAAAAVKKLVGTSVQDDKYAVVRGMSDRYLSTWLNSGPVPSSDPERRAVNLDIFPTEVIDSIVASKAFTPDLPGESAGGNINILTRRFPENFIFEASGGIKYNGATTFNDRWLTYEGGGVPTFGFDGGRDLPAESGGVAPPNPPQSAPTREAGEGWGRATEAFAPVMGASHDDAPLAHSWSAVLGDTVEMMGRPLGVLLAASYDRDFQRYEDDFTGRYTFSSGGRPVPEPFSSNIDTPKLFDVERGEDEVNASGLANISFRPSEGHEISLNLLYSQSAKDEAQISRTPASLGLPDGLEEHVLVYTERSLYSIQLAGEHVFDEHNGLKVEWLGSRGNSSQKEPDSRRFISRYDPSSRYYSLSGFGLTSETPLLRQWREFDDESYTAKIDVTIPFTGDGEDGSFLKTGLYHDYQQRDFSQVEFSYQRGIPPPLVPGARLDYQAEGSESFQEVFFKLPENIGKVQPEDLVDDYIAFGLDPATAQMFADIFAETAMYWFAFSVDSPFGEYDADQLLTAGYLMANIKPSEWLEVVAGARIEMTDLTARSRAPDEAFGEGSIFPFNPGRIQQLDVLPALVVTAEPAKEMNVRLAYSQTVARPTFREFAPVVTRDLIEGEIFRGNPELVMSRIDSFDFRWEWFPRRGDMAGIGVFYKRITDPIEYASNADFVFFEQSEEGRVYGIEMEARKRFDDVGGALGGWDWLRHMEVALNAALLSSEVRKSDRLIRQQELAGSGLPTTRQLQGQPGYTANASIAYDNTDTGTFLGAFYNITGPYLYRAGADPLTPDVFQQPVPQLDFTLSQRFGEHWKVTLRAKNMLDPRSEKTYNYDGVEEYYEHYRKGREYSMSLGFSW